ncbi:MAG: hypothetical protein J6K32_11305 [Clostridia bacterium]|nr:hypothetical protein [Clostridia bacterium]
MSIRRPITAAYVFDRPGLVFRDEDAANLDQLNYSFALVREGRVSGDHWEHIAAYRAFIAAHPHILPVVSVGGWGADGFSQAAATDEGRRLFARTTAELMQEHGFLGVDIDWEYPCSDAAGIAASPDDRENFTLLLRALREELDTLTAKDGKPRLLAAALGASPSLAEHIDCRAVGALLDQVNLMTYDIQTGHVVSHMTPLYSASPRCPMCADLAVRVYSEAGIPKEKIMIGAAFYARLFASADGGAPMLFADSPSAGFDTARYRSLTPQEGWSLHFDEAACAAYSLRGDTLATHDSPRSILGKGAYVRAHGLMGMMCWEYGGDVGGRLLAAMHEGLNP